MKYFLVLVLAASAFGIPLSEENSDSLEDHFGHDGNRELEGDSGSSEELALASSDDWIMEALRQTNMLRAKANLKPLTLDPNLSEGAQRWAEINSCDVKDETSEKDSRGRSYAVIYQPGDKSLKVKESIDDWYGRHSYYDCRYLPEAEMNTQNIYYAVTNFYMNLMGRDKFTVGYGYARCPNQRQEIFVAHYDATVDEVGEMYRNQLAKQKETDRHKLDMAAFVACPKGPKKDFSP